MSIEIIVVIGLGIILLSVFVLFFIPGEQKRKKKHRVKEEVVITQDQWMAKVGRFEKLIHSLREEIETLKKKVKEDEKELLVERVKVKKLQEKLGQERSWLEKEQDSIDKKSNEFKELKDELIRVQEQFAKEHSVNIKHEHKIKDLEKELTEMQEARRAKELENRQLSSKLDAQRAEINQLKKDNLQLKKKSDDVNWIAKTEYDRVTVKLKEAEKQLERVKREDK